MLKFLKDNQLVGRTDMKGTIEESILGEKNDTHCISENCNQHYTKGFHSMWRQNQRSLSRKQERKSERTKRINRVIQAIVKSSRVWIGVRKPHCVLDGSDRHQHRWYERRQGIELWKSSNWRCESRNETEFMTVAAWLMTGKWECLQTSELSSWTDGHIS